MARTVKKSEAVTENRKPSQAGRVEPLVPPSGPANPQPSSTAVAEPPKSTSRPITLTHQMIEERARQLWRQKGCPCGQDTAIWCEAENQLKRELGIK